MLFLFLLLFFLQDPGICEGKYDGDCGIRKIKLKPQIAHGFAVEENEFPWHVALYRLTNTSTYEYICGGSIIDNNIVLTAAHCIYDDVMKDVDTRTIVIAAGKHNSSWEHRDEHEQRFEVIKKMLLPTYRGIETRLQDDIALLVLNSSITFSSAVMPVCLDWKNSYKPTDEDLGTVVGWGYNEKDVLSEKLQLSRMMSSNLSDCRMNIGIALSSLLTSDKICANSLYSSELKEGDSGGGLVFIRNLDKNKERYFIFGVLSVRQSSSYYCLFSSISYHLAWLESKLNTSDEAFVRQDHAPNNKLKMADNINGQNGYSMPYKVEGVEKSTANRKLDPLPANFSRDVPLGPPKQEGGGFTANQPCLWMCHLRRNLSTTQCFPISYFYIRGGWFDGMFLEILIFVVDRCTNRYYILTPTTTVVPRDLILSVMEDLNKSDLRGTPLFVKNHMNT